MVTGHPSPLSALFVGESGTKPASVIQRVADQEEDINLVTASTPEQAVDLVESQRFHCIISDQTVYDSDSVENTKQLRQTGDRRPLILLVEATHDPTFERALEDGVSEVIPLETLDEPSRIVRNRIKFHVGRHRRQRRDRELWFHVRQLIDHAEDVIWIISHEWDELLYANAAFERIWNLSLEELYARPQYFLEGIHPSDRPKVRRAMERVSAGEEVELEFRVNREEDYSIWVWVKGYPITDDEGEIIAVSGFTRDITERKSEEQRYRRERDRFQRLFEHFPEPTVAYRFEDESSRIEAVNEAFEDTFGYESETAVGRDVDELVAPDELLNEAAQLDERVRSGEFVDAEVRRNTAEGDRYFRFRSIELPDDDEFDGFAIYADIHERKQRERTLNALHETSRELARTQEQAAIAQVATNAVDDTIGVPWGATWLLDEGTEMFTPAHLTSSLEQSMPERVEIPTDDPLVDAIDREDEIQLDDTASSDIWPSALSPVRSALVLPLGGHGFFLIGSPEPNGLADEHRSFARILAANTEAALERADREVTLRQQRRELQRQNERLEEFTSVVSHDLRTPLSVATATTEQLSLEHEDVDVSTIENALNRMDNIISKTLTLARSGQVMGDVESVDLYELAMRCRHTVSASDLDIEIDEDLPTIEADPDRLQHVFENLYRNAVDHGGPDVTITVEPTADGFSVSDDGPGISAEEVENVFETGYSTTAEGTGFGLAIVKRIAESHGWEIHVEESSSGGASFRFSDVY